MIARPWTRGLAGLLGLWLTLLWAGPNARVNCPMHAGTAAVETGGAHGQHGSHSHPTPGGDRDGSGHQGCNCTWCPTEGRQAALDTARLPEAPVATVAQVVVTLPTFRSVELASTPHHLPFAIGPPSA